VHEGVRDVAAAAVRARRDADIPAAPVEPIAPPSPPTAPLRASAPPSGAGGRSLPPRLPTLRVEPLETGATEGLLGPLDAIPRIVVRTEDIAKLPINHQAAFVLGFVDGTSSWETILDACGLPRADGVRLLSDLRARGIIA